MTAPTLSEFLLARIAEDEVVARAATGGPWTFHAASQLHFKSAGWVGSPGPTTQGGVFVAEVSNCADGLDDGGHIARHDPARVLAECKAKRRIVEVLRHPYLHGEPQVREYAAMTLEIMARVWVDHPYYRESWRA